MVRIGHDFFLVVAKMLNDNGDVNTTKRSRQQPGLFPSKPPPWKYKNLYHQTRRLLLIILLRPDASTLVFHPPSTSRDINWSAPSITAQFNTPSKPHTPRTVFNRENHNTHRPSTPTIFPYQYPLPELSITTLPTTIPIRNTTAMVKSLMVKHALL
jgi:hypothetical protein